ncbi:MAG: DUF839 domain-containing protein [Phycisphaeraceae bacterium]|nr:DUF839 domain-containing protein [Phycisphaeraceae bacterium]
MIHVLFSLCCLLVAGRCQVVTKVVIEPVTEPVTQGPSSSVSPYLLPVAAGVQVRSLLTAGDSVNSRQTGEPYLFVGTPDGLGAFDNGDHTFTLLVNHENGKNKGIERAHGARGAFISKWTIDIATTRVIHGEDLVKRVVNWDRDAMQYKLPGSKDFISFCSATLMPNNAFYDPTTKRGTRAMLYFNGEEVNKHGYAYAHVVDGPEAGTSYELPRFSRAAWENIVPHPAIGLQTMIIGLDDSYGGQLYLYHGEKLRDGSVADKAGLTNGLLYGIAVEGVPAENREQGIGGVARDFTLASLGDASGFKGPSLEEKSVKLSVTAFNRPEDGHWDPMRLSDFYFTTTDRYDISRYKNPAVREKLNALKIGKLPDQIGRTRLWRLRFKDSNNLILGGTIKVMLDSKDHDIQMLDNITIDRLGHVLMQEDTANAPRNPKVWQYTIADGTLKCLAELDPARFGSLGRTPTPPFTVNCETSGIIDASDLLGPGWFLLDVQAHHAVQSIEQISGGQLLALYNPDSDPRKH